jgi:glycosyltransferase involved in cell wall biosynthesis
MATYYRQISPNVNLVAISHAQQRQAPDVSWAGTIHNAVPVTAFPFARTKGAYALFLGRLAPEKGLSLAIDAARAAGVPLVIAAKHSEPEERAYFDAEVAPRLGPDVTWVGEVGGDRKLALLAGARCLLFPVRWEEPFGMVLIEALACGTPVVALRRGAVPEIITDGLTGLICDDPAQLPAALHRVRSIKPVDCRREVERRFDSATMAASYLLTYRRAIERAANGATARQSATAPVPARTG